MTANTLVIERGCTRRVTESISLSFFESSFAKVGITLGTFGVIYNSAGHGTTSFMLRISRGCTLVTDTSIYTLDSLNWRPSPVPSLRCLLEADFYHTLPIH